MCSAWRYIAILTMGLTVVTNSHGSKEYRYPDIKQIVFAGQFKRITVDVHQDSDVVVESVTPGDNVSFQRNGDMLSIKAVSNNLTSSRIVNGNITNIVIGENANSVISMGVIGDGATHRGQPPVEVSLRVPKGMDLRLEGNIANAQIGDTSGNLMLDMSGKGKIETGSVGDVSARLAGATSTHIARIAGDLRVDIAGSGNLTVDSGEIPSLDVATSGASSVNVNAVANKANIEVTGTGIVRVKQVRTKPDVSIRGAGTVDVGG